MQSCAISMSRGLIRLTDQKIKRVTSSPLCALGNMAPKTRRRGGENDNASDLPDPGIEPHTCHTVSDVLTHSANRLVRLTFIIKIIKNCLASLEI